MLAENKLADMSTEFAIQILKLTDNIKGHYSLSNQLERSGTSMWIDVGFIERERTYYITTVADDTLEGWNNPLSALETQNRSELIDILQQEIFRCRA